LRLRGKSPASAPTATTTSRRSGGSPRGTYLSDLQRYADSVRGAAATRGRRLKTLKQLLSFVTRVKYLPFNAGAAIRGPALDQKLAAPKGKLAPGIGWILHPRLPPSKFRGHP
jgi:hypothetical protein